MRRAARAALGAAALALLACWGEESEPALPAGPEEPGVESRAPEPPARGPAPAPAPAPVPEPPAGPTLDLDALAERIERTTAIGAFTKLALKGDSDELLDAIGRHHREGRGQIEKLRNRFEALTLKIQTLLEPEEPELAAALGRSREQIWDLLADPETFASLRS